MIHKIFGKIFQYERVKAMDPKKGLNKRGFCKHGFHAHRSRLIRIILHAAEIKKHYPHNSRVFLSLEISLAVTAVQTDCRYNIMTFTSTHSISRVFTIPETSGGENV
jgi:hypothetical protein